ncbi:MAG: hypothetical protein AB1796_02840 [Bacillota bacterium]
MKELFFLLFVLNLLWLCGVLPLFPGTARDSYRYFFQKTASRYSSRCKPEEKGFLPFPLFFNGYSRRG